MENIFWKESIEKLQSICPEGLTFDTDLMKTGGIVCFRLDENPISLPSVAWKWVTTYREHKGGVPYFSMMFNSKMALCCRAHNSLDTYEKSTESDDNFWETSKRFLEFAVRLKRLELEFQEKGFDYSVNSQLK